MSKVRGSMFKFAVGDKVAVFSMPGVLKRTVSPGTVTAAFPQPVGKQPPAPGVVVSVEADEELRDPWYTIALEDGSTTLAPERDLLAWRDDRVLGAKSPSPKAGA